MLDYRNILRAASDPHKSMRTMEVELLFPEEYQKTILYAGLAFCRSTGLWAQLKPSIGVRLR